MAQILKSRPSCSAGLFQRRQNPPPTGQPPVHRRRHLKLAAGQRAYGRRHLGHGLIGAQRLVVEQMDQAAVVEFDQAMWVELLQPAADLRQFREQPQGCFARAGDRPWRNAKLAAFGATRRPNRSADGDADLETLLVANTPIVTLVGKAWTLHVDEALRTTREENLAMVADSVRYLPRPAASAYSR